MARFGRPGARSRLVADEEAMTFAFRLLARRSRTEAEMRGALERRSFGPTRVRRVLQRLRRLGYIDDAKFAAEWSERLQSRGFGSQSIRQRLRERGVAEELAERVTPGAEEERLTARRILEARFGEEPIAGGPRRARAARFLAARGFPEEVVESLLDPWEE